MKTISAAVLSLTVIIAPVAIAAEEGQSEHQQQGVEYGQAHMLHGVVNSVNAAAGQVNITHDPVESLKWPKMKMNFKARDAALLKDLKPGMTVDFEIEKMGNEYLVTAIAPVK
jgi:Cu(I)/Ag(I) efflux system periplasmic protein CusF